MVYFRKSTITLFYSLKGGSVCGNKHDEFKAIDHPNQQFTTVGKTQRAIRDLAYGATKITGTICRTTQVCVIVVFGRCTGSYFLSVVCLIARCLFLSLY